MTNCLRTRINQHNSGYGSSTTAPPELRPFALMAYICGFDGQRDLMFHIERQWKLKRDRVRASGSYDPKEWALAGQEAISYRSTSSSDYSSEQRSELKLVLLFK